MSVRLVIVPEGTSWDSVSDTLPRGSMQSIANADFVVTTSGHVLKDRYLELEVDVLPRADVARS